MQLFFLVFGRPRGGCYVGLALFSGASSILCQCWIIGIASVVNYFQCCYLGYKTVGTYYLLVDIVKFTLLYVVKLLL